MSRINLILCFMLIGLLVSATDQVLPDLTPSVKELRTPDTSGSKKENPFFANGYNLTHRFVLANTDDIDKKVTPYITKFVILERTDSQTGKKETLLWEINQSEPKKGETFKDSKKINPIEDVKNLTRFLIMKNGAKDKYTYPHKLIIPGRSRFMSMLFLDYLQTWVVDNVSGDTITLKPHILSTKSGGKISGTIDIPTESSYDIEAINSNPALSNGDIITMGVEKINKAGGSPVRTSVIVTLINLTKYQIDNNNTNIYTTGKFTQ
jgi:hypothetical protein